MAPETSKNSRTLISLPEAELRWLRQVGKKRGLSMASVVREAVAEYHARVETTDSLSVLKKTAGSWKPRSGEALDYVEKLRREWDR